MRCAILLLAAGCAASTDLGIDYQADQLAQLDIATVDPDQIDAAWETAAALWDAGAPTGILVIFHDTPIESARGPLAGLTVGTQVNVYLLDTSCLFRDSNQGTLLHELGHAISYLQTGSEDPGHAGPQWEHVDGARHQLEVEFCNQQ